MKTQFRLGGTVAAAGVAMSMVGPRRISLARVGAVLVALALVLALDAAAVLADDGSDGTILFEVGQENPLDLSTFEIYVMDADGGNRTQLTANSHMDRWPHYSPDGEQIVFVSDRDGTFDIWVMDADGSNPTNLTNTPDLEEITPNWSPDVERIAFAGAPVGSFENFAFEGYEIYVMDLDGDDDDDDDDDGGSGIRQLTDNDAEDSSPNWSPNGRKIAFISFRDGNYEVYVMRANGRRQRNLTNDPAEDGFTLPALDWSPDGRQIAFPSNRDGAFFFDFDIYVMDVDGDNPANLTNTPGSFEGTPVWSPGGDQIAFNTFRPGNDGLEVYVMDTDGGNQTNLTNTPFVDEVTGDWGEFEGDDDEGDDDDGDDDDGDDDDDDDDGDSG